MYMICTWYIFILYREYLYYIYSNTNNDNLYEYIYICIQIHVHILEYIMNNMGYVPNHMDQTALSQEKTM